MLLVAMPGAPFVASMLLAEFQLGHRVASLRPSQEKRRSLKVTRGSFLPPAHLVLIHLLAKTASQARTIQALSRKVIQCGSLAHLSRELPAGEFHPRHFRTNC